MSALSRIEAQGFAVKLMGDGFEITPASALTQQQREFLKAYKAEIIAELKQVAQITKDSPIQGCNYCHDCSNLSNGRCKLNFRLVNTVLWCGFHPKNAELSRATGEGQL